jgi:flagellar assembly factor FliW
LAAKEQIVKLSTTRFGTIEVVEKEVLLFSNGIPGFPETRRYVMLDHGPGTPLKWLQSVERPQLAFPVIAATELIADYHITIAPDDLSTLGVQAASDLLAFVILTIPCGAPELTTVNLKAPLIINPAMHLGCQVLVAEDYPIRHPLSERQPAECAG